MRVVGGVHKIICICIFFFVNVITNKKSKWLIELVSVLLVARLPAAPVAVVVISRGVSWGMVVAAPVVEATT
jgi:hypothetical protein